MSPLYEPECGAEASRPVDILGMDDTRTTKCRGVQRARRRIILYVIAVLFSLTVDEEMGVPATTPYID